ncbi:Fumarylacetoacetase [Pseudocohnilembus persalinus]|uniref:Fumarylacetoacetase n=1 Tax=Pseudocohnilembus persalinus TaxID=266149 RepID=A0A0V0QWJ3_PSEPJ|nr:Fumarylacetoacetase [Pseudocohnilembus persalinus]|eukprot:KRX06687.1 Fumarylacetoacetase [Pseudocohnilembus persalinus]
MELYKQIITKTHPKIVAIGKNYAAHVKEMGGNQPPSEPVIFTKQFTSIVPPETKNVVLKNFQNDIHHEVELGFMIKKQAKDVKNIKIEDYVAGYFLGIDLTDREKQAQMKKKGFPWDLAKGFDNALPISEFVPFEKVKDVNNLDLVFKVNGKITQNGNTSQMIHKVENLIEFVSKFMTLNPGDLFITGTPSGVGPVKHGDNMVGQLIQNGEVLAEINKNIQQQQKPNL